MGTQQHAPLLAIPVPASKGVNGVTNGVSNGYANGVAVGLPSPTPDRSSFSQLDSVKHLWEGMDLPGAALDSISFTGEGLGLPSSFKVGHIAQASIGISALTAALLHSTRTASKVPKVTVPLKNACADFLSERLYVLEGENQEDLWGPVGGLHKTSDGHVRIHDSFPNHRFGAIALLGLSAEATRPELSKKTQEWAAIDLERKFQTPITVTQKAHSWQGKLSTATLSFRHFDRTSNGTCCLKQGRLQSFPFRSISYLLDPRDCHLACPAGQTNVFEG